MVGDAMPKPMTLTEAVASTVGAISDLEESLGIPYAEKVESLSPATISGISHISLMRNTVMNSNDRIRRIIEVLKENL